MFQNPDEQIFHNTVRAEIEFGPGVLGFDEAKIKEKTEWAADICGLTEHMEENPYNLPLSIRKFVTIASVLAMDEKILVLDEPTAGQDLHGIKCLENILSELEKKGTTVITITHDMEFVVNNFPRVFVMAHKNLLKVGTAREIFRDDALLEESMLKKDVYKRQGVIRIFTRLRVDEKDEMIGLDVTQHGENAYPSFNGFD